MVITHVETEGLKGSDIIQVPCSACGESFSLTLGEFRRRFAGRQQCNIYCTIECRLAGIPVPKPRPKNCDGYGRRLVPTFYDDDYQNRYYLGDF